MHIMKSTYGLPALRIALLAVCAAATAPLFAQDAPPPPPPQGSHAPRDPARMQAMMLKHMTRELSLTPDQVTQVQTIQTDEAAKMTALNADTGDAGKDKHRQEKAIREDENTRIKAVLTDDQKTRFDAMEASQRERRGHHPGGEGGAPAGGDTPPPPPPPSL